MQRTAINYERKDTEYAKSQDLAYGIGKYMNTKKKLDGYVLKLIACAAIAVNYLSLVVFNSDNAGIIVGNIIGRISFPILAYLIVEGFFHSSDLKKYVIRLLALAVISEPCMDFALGTYKGGIAGMMQYQNPVFTLLIGLIAVYFYDKIVTKYQNDNFKMNMYGAGVILLSAFLAVLIKSDYSIVGILMIIIFYLFRKNSRMMFIAFVAICGVFMDQTNSITIVYSFAPMLALPLIYKYSGQEGRKNKILFYAFYPVLLLLVGIIRIL